MAGCKESMTTSDFDVAQRKIFQQFIASMIALTSWFISLTERVVRAETQSETIQQRNFPGIINESK
jgi:hypothetical protein